MEYLDIIEWTAVIFNLAFIILIIKEKKLGWFFGIVGSLLSVYIFYVTKLYSEAILYLFYAFAGGYGWVVWTKKTKNNPVQKWPLSRHIKLFFAGLLGTLGLGYFFNSQSDAAMPYADAFSSAFSFVATFMEAQKVLSAWIYWLILSVFSVWLYASRDLNVYAWLMVINAFLCVVGFAQWRKSYRLYHSLG